MAVQEINVGTVANDGTGDTLRAAMQKINTNFQLAQVPEEPIALLAGTWTQVTLPTAYDDDKYQLAMTGYDADGNVVGLRRRNKAADGFEVRAAAACTLEYIAYKG